MHSDGIWNYLELQRKFCKQCPYSMHSDNIWNDLELQRTFCKQCLLSMHSESDGISNALELQRKKENKDTYACILRLLDACSVGTSHFVSDVNKCTIARRFKQMATTRTYKPWIGNSPVSGKTITNNIFYPAALARTQYISEIQSICWSTFGGYFRAFPYCMSLFPWIRIGLYILRKIRFNSMNHDDDDAKL